MSDVSQGIREMLDKYQAAVDRIRQLESARDAAYHRGLEDAAKVADAVVADRTRQIESPMAGEIKVMRWSAGRLQAKLIAAAIRALPK